MVSGTHALLKLVVVEVQGGAGQRPQGVDDLCFHTYGEFSPSSPPPPGIGALGLDLDLQAEILASRLRFGPQGWDLGLEARIWA